MILSMRSRRSTSYEQPTVRELCYCFAFDATLLSIAFTRWRSNFAILSQTQVWFPRPGQIERFARDVLPQLRPKRWEMTATIQPQSNRTIALGLYRGWIIGSFISGHQTRPPRPLVGGIFLG